MSRTADPNTVVYVVDDDPGARKSVAALAQSHGARTMEFASAEEFLETADDQMQGCLVVDVRMEGMSGLDLQLQLLERGITLPVVVITGYANVPMAVQAMKAGAVSFLTKPCNPHKLWENITDAVEQSRADRGARVQRDSAARRLATLTDDERVVLAKVMEGLPNKRIARDLDIGLRTVELRRANLMKKMEVGSLAELVQLAVMAGFPPSESVTLPNSEN